MPLPIAIVLSLALHLAACFLADRAGLHAPPPPAPNPLLEATLILPEAAFEPPTDPSAAALVDETPATGPVPEPPPAATLLPASTPVTVTPTPAPAPVSPQPPPAGSQPLAKPTPPEFYPHEAVRRGLEGEVLVAVTLDGRGRVTGARLERGCGHAILDEAAVRAARSLRHIPAGAGETILPVSFRLK